jgi:IS605 OrfB family transposase
MRLEKLQKRELYLRECQEKGIIPKVIFGGRKNFFKRMEGKISNKEWKELRSNHIYSRGDKTKSGNLNIRLVYEKDKFYIEIADTLKTNDKNNRSPRIKAEVSIADKFFNKVIDTIIPDKGYNVKTKKQVDIYKPYTIQIIRKKNEYYVHLTIEEEVSGRELGFSELPVDDKVAGIDINIDRIALTILSKEGNFLKSKVFYYHEMEYVKSNRRSNLAGETAKEVIDDSLSENIGAIVIEDLKFSQDHDTNKKFNRLTSNFAKQKLVNALTHRALRHGFLIKKVNPAYTSVIGKYKYSKIYGLSVHEAASFVIGRRGLGFVEKLPKELIKILKNEVKPHIIKTLGSMEETYKKSESGKSQRKFLGMLLRNIDDFKQNHAWKTWNVVQKALKYKEHKLVLAL